VLCVHVSAVLSCAVLCWAVLCPTSLDEVKAAAGSMLGHKLVTKQTGPEGQLVSKVLVNASVEIEKEFYFAAMMDRASHGPVIIVSKQGGMDIEEVAEKDPEAVIKVGLFPGTFPLCRLRPVLICTHHPTRVGSCSSSGVLWSVGVCRPHWSRCCVLLWSGGRCLLTLSLA
jgi:hypothetical protein